MLTLVTAAEASLEAFLSVSAASRYQERLRKYLESLLGQPCTRPDWCVLGLEGGVPVARAAFWALPGQDVPTDLVLVEPGVGEDAFVEAIAATYEGTRDSWIGRSIAEHGLLGAAHEDFNDYREMEHRPEWFELA